MKYHMQSMRTCQFYVRILHNKFAEICTCFIVLLCVKTRRFCCCCYVLNGTKTREKWEKQVWLWLSRIVREKCFLVRRSTRMIQKFPLWRACSKVRLGVWVTKKIVGTITSGYVWSGSNTFNYNSHCLNMLEVWTFFFRIKVSGSLPSISLGLTDTKLQQMVKVISLLGQVFQCHFS